MKYVKQFILICFATISLLFCFTQPVYARMGSSGDGGGDSTTTTAPTGGDSLSPRSRNNDTLVNTVHEFQKEIFLFP